MDVNFQMIMGLAEFLFGKNICHVGVDPMKDYKATERSVNASVSNNDGDTTIVGDRSWCCN